MKKEMTKAEKAALKKLIQLKFEEAFTLAKERGVIVAIENRDEHGNCISQVSINGSLGVALEMFKDKKQL